MDTTSYGISFCIFLIEHNDIYGHGTPVWFHSSDNLLMKKVFNWFSIDMQLLHVWMNECTFCQYRTNLDDILNQLKWE